MHLSTCKLIYNPYSGQKRKLLPGKGGITLEEIRELLDQYQIPVDLFPTEYPGHAIKLAKQAKKEGYDTVLVAGGDGTVGETANGLVGTDVTLGIIPLGSFMNVARMLSIPTDPEKAIELIKIGRKRKIDMGSITLFNGEKLTTPYYFIESAGVGLEAELHYHFLQLEKGNMMALIRILGTLFYYYGNPVKIIIDKKEFNIRATVVTISNGPYTGAALKLAPEAKLNDHKLTISLFHMSKFELIRFIYNALRLGKTWSSKITTYQGDTIRIESKITRLVHADARKYGQTPIECEIIPNALQVFTGFPKNEEEAALKKRTILDLSV